MTPNPLQVSTDPLPLGFGHGSHNHPRPVKSKKNHLVLKVNPGNCCWMSSYASHVASNTGKPFHSTNTSPTLHFPSFQHLR